MSCQTATLKWHNSVLNFVHISFTIQTSVTPLDKIEIDAKIVNRTNVCYEEEKQMEETTKTLLEYATYEELLILLNLAESMLQPSERTHSSALVS